MKMMSLTTHPCVDLALVAANDSLDVVLHDRDQGGLVVDGGDPAGHLAVPDQLTSQSAPLKLNLPREGSVASNFMEFSGVIWPKLALAALLMLLWERMPWSLAVPQYLNVDQ